MPGIKAKIGNALGKLYIEHAGKIYPYFEEDNEGVITWESPRRCRMLFTGIDVCEGYQKTVNMYKKAHLYRYINITIDGNYVVVQF